MNVAEKNVENNVSELKVITSDAFARQENSDEMEIDLVDVALMLLDRVHYIIFFLLLGAVLLNAFAFFFIAPKYESTARMYIVSASDDSVVDLTDLNIGTNLTADYEELIMSYPVLDQVIEKLGLDLEPTDEEAEADPDLIERRMGSDFDSEELAKMIEISNPTDTRILDITVTSKDPELSRDIANTVVAVATDYLPRTMGTEEPNVAQDARAAVRKSSPSLVRFTLIGALIGMLLYCGYVIVRYMLDDTVHTAEDIEKYFGIVPLTSIPDIDMVNENHEKRKRQREKKLKRKKMIAQGDK